MATTTTSRKNDTRGNSADRARQGEGLARHWGNGTTCGCIYCGLVLELNAGPNGERQENTLTRDRLVPGAAGGRYIMKNLGPACFDCNVRKGDLSLDEFCGTERADRIRAIAAEYRRGGPVRY